MHVSLKIKYILMRCPILFLLMFCTDLWAQISVKWEEGEQLCQELEGRRLAILSLKNMKGLKKLINELEVGPPIEKIQNWIESLLTPIINGKMINETSQMRRKMSKEIKKKVKNMNQKHANDMYHAFKKTDSKEILYQGNSLFNAIVKTFSLSRLNDENVRAFDEIDSMLNENRKGFWKKITTKTFKQRLDLFWEDYVSKKSLSELNFKGNDLHILKEKIENYDALKNKLIEAAGTSKEKIELAKKQARLETIVSVRKFLWRAYINLNLLDSLPYHELGLE